MSQVQHNEERNRFLILIDGVEATLSYNFTEAGSTVDIYSTFVPPEGRGKGLAGQLAEAALKWAKENELKVRPTCSYIDSYLSKHLEWQDLRK